MQSADSQPALKSLKSYKKIGFIVPSSNVALEIITASVMTQLPLVSVHYSRIPVTTTSIAAGAAAQFTTAKLVEVAKLISNAPVDCVVWNGTSESWTGEGHEAGLRIKNDIESTCGVPSTTTSLATLEALKILGVQRISMATPYSQDNNDRLKEYFANAGVEVVADEGLDIAVNNDIADVELEDIKALIGRVDRPDAQCIVIPCTNFPAGFIVEEMEKELGKPVVDSILVTLWSSLRLIGVREPIDSWGELFRIHS